MSQPSDTTQVWVLSPPTRSRRVIQAGAALVCVAAVTAAALLRPDPRGIGTHEQVGLPPCTFYAITRLPCPGCGMTTAFANTVRFRLGAAFWANPFGAALCLGIMLLGAFSIACLVTNWRAWDRLRHLTANRFIWPAIGVFFASWLFTILRTLYVGAR